MICWPESSRSCSSDRTEESMATSSDGSVLGGGCCNGLSAQPESSACAWPGLPKPTSTPSKPAAPPRSRPSAVDTQILTAECLDRRNMARRLRSERAAPRSTLERVRTQQRPEQHTRPTRDRSRGKSGTGSLEEVSRNQVCCGRLVLLADALRLSRSQLEEDRRPELRPTSLQVLTCYHVSVQLRTSSPGRAIDLCCRFGV